MKVKYSPTKWNVYPAPDFSESTKPDTEIKVTAENTITIDGEDFTFDPESVIWPDIAEQTDGKILEAHRTDGELFVTVRRFYTQSCSSWDSGSYHEVTP